MERRAVYDGKQDRQTMERNLKAILAAVGALLVFTALIQGYLSAVEEVAGLQVAKHSLNFCPNWVLGIATGALAVGLAWWVWPERKER